MDQQRERGGRQNEKNRVTYWRGVNYFIVCFPSPAEFNSKAARRKLEQDDGVRFIGGG